MREVEGAWVTGASFDCGGHFVNLFIIGYTAPPLRMLCDCMGFNYIRLNFYLLSLWK